MDDQILFEIAKYVESSSNARGRLRQALASKETRHQRFQISRKIIERKISMREDLECLRDKNIYRDEDSKVNFQRIHRRLERVIVSSYPHKPVYSTANISPRIACLAKNLDFELRKRMLQRALWRISPVQDLYSVCTHSVHSLHAEERRTCCLAAYKAAYAGRSPCPQITGTPDWHGKRKGSANKNS